MDLAPSLNVTLLYAGLLGVVWFVLTWGVIRVRQTQKVVLGDGGNKLLSRRIRGHGNFTESVPLGLILLALLEYNGGSATLIHGLGIILVIGRVLHGYAFWNEKTNPLCRMGGMTLSLLAILISAVTALLLGLGVI